MKAKYILIVSGLLFLFACAPSRFIEPLEKKQIAVGANLGGPLIKFAGKPIPIPFSAIEIGYGLDSNLTIHGGIHTTALTFYNLQFDAGLTYKVINQKKYIPNISVNPGFNFIYDMNDKVAKFWPTFDANAYWNYGARRNYFYTGIGNMFELSQSMANGQEQKQRWLLSPQIGHVLKGKRDRFQFTTEFKFLGLNQTNTYSFIPYQSFFGSHGTTGIYLGFRYILN